MYIFKKLLLLIYNDVGFNKLIAVPRIKRLPSNKCGHLFNKCNIHLKNKVIDIFSMFYNGLSGFRAEYITKIQKLESTML